MFCFPRGAGLGPGSPQAARARDASYHAAVETLHGFTVVRWSKRLDDVHHQAQLISEQIGRPVERNFG